MPPLAVRLSVVAALALLLAVGGARAGFTDWSYEWGGSPFAVPANGGTRQGAINLELPGDAVAPAPVARAAVAPIVLRAFTSLFGGADRYNDAAYSLTFTVSDPDSHQTHVLTVKGAFNGTVTSNWVSLGNTFTGGSGSQTVDFLGQDFTVDFGFRQTEGSPRTWTGNLTASVFLASDAVPAVSPGAVGSPTAAAPEPAALTLALLALPALGLLTRRLRGRRISRPATGAAG